jgi:hypothetical protein
MRTLALFTLFLAFSPWASAQTFRCAFQGAAVRAVEAEFDTYSDQLLQHNMEEFLEAVCDEIGLDADDFDITAASNVANFQAECDEDYDLHVIYFGLNFVRNLSNRLTPDEFEAVVATILAHELAHLELEHVHHSGNSPHKRELEADYVAGRVMSALDFEVEDALIIYRRIVPEGSTSTHPGQSTRINAVVRGYNSYSED